MPAVPSGELTWWTTTVWPARLGICPCEANTPSMDHSDSLTSLASSWSPKMVVSVSGDSRESSRGIYTKHVAFGGGSLMVWGDISTLCTIPLCHIGGSLSGQRCLEGSSRLSLFPIFIRLDLTQSVKMTPLFIVHRFPPARWSCQNGVTHEQSRSQPSWASLAWVGPPCRREPPSYCKPSSAASKAAAGMGWHPLAFHWQALQLSRAAISWMSWHEWWPLSLLTYSDFSVLRGILLTTLYLTFKWICTSNCVLILMLHWMRYLPKEKLFWSVVSEKIYTRLQLVLNFCWRLYEMTTSNETNQVWLSWICRIVLNSSTVASRKLS